MCVQLHLLVVSFLIDCRSSFDYQMQKRAEAEEHLKEYVSRGVIAGAGWGRGRGIPYEVVR